MIASLKAYICLKKIVSTLYIFTQLHTHLYYLPFEIVALSIHQVHKHWTYLLVCEGWWMVGGAVHSGSVWAVADHSAGINSVHLRVL